MYYISKSFEIAASHHLVLDYPSKCRRVHGHNYSITIWCRSESLDKNGMVVDFGVVKSEVFDKIDHKDLNEVLPFNPTSENLAKWICDRVPNCYKVSVQETKGNLAVYSVD